MRVSINMNEHRLVGIHTFGRGGATIAFGRSVLGLSLVGDPAGLFFEYF